ncbi:MAG: CaiB/BaiF CoA transferase family protein [Chloroflexota bacterium]
MSGPLEGIRVLELARHLAGPFAAMTLGDLGADVIKVEPPGRGDDTRRFPPYWNGESTYYLSTNRNKRSIEVDIRSPEGQHVIRQLVGRSDILIENFRPGTAERYGIGYDELSRINPGLIYCAVSAFGQDGPDRDRAGVDLLMQAATGLMSITGEEGRPPVRAGTSLIDLTAGSNAVQGILAALYVREKTKRGQRVDVSLLGAGVSWLTYHVTAYFASGEVPERLGSNHASVAPYGAYPTNDGYLVLAVATDALWERLCRAIGAEYLLEDERFTSNPDRTRHRNQLDELLEPIFARRSTDEWTRLLSQAGVPSGPVNTIDEVVTMPQVEHDSLVVSIPRDDIPDFRMAGPAISLSDTRATVRRPPPKLGEHTAEVLRELGIESSQAESVRGDD